MNIPKLITQWLIQCEANMTVDLSMNIIANITSIITKDSWKELQKIFALHHMIAADIAYSVNHYINANPIPPRGLPGVFYAVHSNILIMTPLTSSSIGRPADSVEAQNFIYALNTEWSILLYSINLGVIKGGSRGLMVRELDL